MDRTTIIRAWKDPEYRASLTHEERSALPESPSGKSMAELSEEDLGAVTGGLLRAPVLQLNGALMKPTQCVCTHHCGLGDLTAAIYPSPGGLPPG